MSGLALVLAGLALAAGWLVWKVLGHPPIEDTVDRALTDYADVDLAWCDDCDGYVIR